MTATTLPKSKAPAPASTPTVAPTPQPGVTPASPPAKYIKWFADIAIEDIPLVGGKNASLGEMYRQLTAKGVRVPNGFAITAEAYRYVLDRAYERAWAAEMLGVVDGRPQGKPRIDEIQRATALHFGIRREEMLSYRRSRVVARPRQVAMYLAKQLTQKSLPAIGRGFADRDHTSVLHAVRRIEALLPRDAELAASVARIREALNDPERQP